MINHGSCRRDCRWSDRSDRAQDMQHDGRGIWLRIEVLEHIDRKDDSITSPTMMRNVGLRNALLG
jgi:hypothetical protein